MGKPGAAVRAAGWVTVGVIAAGGVAAAATTGDGSGAAPTGTLTATSPSAPATANPATKGKHGRRGLAVALGRRVLHGQATVLGKDGKPVVVAEQRGTVTAVSPTSISLASSDGFRQTYVVTPTTRVRIDGKKSAIADVKVGQTAGVLAKVEGASQTATIVIERPAKPAK